MSNFEPEIYYEEIWTYLFYWFSEPDACVPKCQSLNGQTFSDQDVFQETLYSPIWGDIFDLETGVPLTHPHCRCQVQVKAECDLREVNELTEYQSFLEMIQ